MKRFFENEPSGERTVSVVTRPRNIDATLPIATAIRPCVRWRRQGKATTTSSNGFCISKPCKTSFQTTPTIWIGRCSTIAQTTSQCGRFFAYDAVEIDECQYCQEENNLLSSTNSHKSDARNEGADRSCVCQGHHHKSWITSSTTQ
jgi:hypothetical protein